MKTTRQLLELLARPGIIRSLGVHDAFTALVCEQAGLEMIFLGGFGVAASHLGVPDLGLLSMPEMADAVRRLTDRLQVPLVADADTGGGDLHQVARTVRQFERAGAAGLLLEDQLEPKRCGHFAGKQVIPLDEMLLKLRAALDAREDGDFVIIARTDARAVEGLDAAIGRAQQYAAAGADMCFVEAPRSPEELQRIAREIDRPQLVNMLTGGVTPILSAGELAALGFKIMVCPVATLLATGFAVRKLASTLLNEGRIDQLGEMLTEFDDLKRTLGLDEFLAIRQRLEEKNAS